MTKYKLLSKQIVSLSEGCNKPITVLANAAALLWQEMPDINWAGFYLWDNGSLYLGPFQGKTACTVIPDGKGVCGTASLTREIQLVPDVHAFPGHIACDSASRSEVVIPMTLGSTLYGVLDIDSPLPSRFSEQDASGLQMIVDAIMEWSDWENGLL